MQLSDEQKKSLEEFALKKYDSLHDTHGRKHAYRTANLAAGIAKKEGADILVCRYGALLHQYHPEGVEEVRNYLRSISLVDSVAEEILHCVACVEPDTITNARTLEAKVVFDADKLQTLGPFGFIREVIYRTATKSIGFLDVIEEARNLQRQMHRLIQTQTGKMIAKDLMNQSAWMLGSFDKWKQIAEVNSTSPLDSILL